jgi:hypothetical protein
LVGSLSLGPLWARWRLPKFWVIVLFFLPVIALTFVFAWVFNNTKGNVFMAMLLHGSLNAFWLNALPHLFPTPLVTGYGANIPALVDFRVVTLMIVALMRGRLGYQHYRQEEEELDPAPVPT